MKKNKPFTIFIILFIALVAIFIFSLCVGSVNISAKDILNALFGKLIKISSSNNETSAISASTIIIRSIRLPRVLAGLLAGIGLASAGVVLQGIMNNSLAGPNTIGVNSGAGFFVMLAMLFLPGKLWATPVFAFIGSLITTLAIFLLAYLGDRSRTTIILAGITVSSFLSAGINLIKLLDTDISINITTFLVGSLAGINANNLYIPAIGIVIAFIILLFLAKALNMLALGDEIAMSLGLNINVTRFSLLILSSILAGCVVSFAGLLSFVGLIVPHICRKLVGNDAKLLLPCSALLGGCFVMLSDALGRVIFAPYELPVGIIMAFIGGPFFMYLLLKKKGGRRLNA